MALTKKTKLTLCDVSPYKIVGDDKKVYEGFLYKGFDPDNVVVSFTAPDKEWDIYDCDRYDKENSEDFILYGYEFRGVIKYRTEKREK